ncbi:hypothetical protein SR1949_50490 [Sphaerospermopsis reniformis]|uniref:PIN domain-containing protein n=1 Tax=Sphaerospermopsis reniformis TaxID=531300 RepID=A0A480A9I3_9CYAN|nr:hypothetical protein [Sphaerospermopsis reniformis]GCL39918.1 hypothetical protein SR1949_50490 [Sphaerospermopsis reniformis]
MESMIAVDTNIVIRFITKDDELQYQQSLALFKNKNIFIPDTVILELILMHFKILTKWRIIDK